MDEEINNQEEFKNAEVPKEKRKWNKTPLLIAVLVILTAVLVVLAVPARLGVNYTKESPAPMLKKADLSISEPKSLGFGSYSADVNIDSNDYTVSGADLVIKYDTKVVTNLKVANGTLFSNVTILHNTTDPVKGIASYSAAAGIASKGVRGKGVFAVLTFNVFGSPSASTSISLEKGTQVAAEGQSVSVLGEASGVTFIPGTK